MSAIDRSLRSLILKELLTGYETSRPLPLPGGQCFQNGFEIHDARSLQDSAAPATVSREIASGGAVVTTVRRDRAAL